MLRSALTRINTCTKFSFPNVPLSRTAARSEGYGFSPSYGVLDPILQAYVEEDQSVEMISGQGFKSKMVEEIAAKVDLNEYKRRQAPPGIKITPRAFGRDRRLPITNRYRMKKALKECKGSAFDKEIFDCETFEVDSPDKQLNCVATQAPHSTRPDAISPPRH